MLALDHDLDVVIGVDNHKHTHPAGALNATGSVLEEVTVPSDPGGYRKLIAFGQRHRAALWAIEGTGSVGAGLTSALLARGERVVEVDRPQRPARRGGVKSDGIDAVRAARQAIAGVGLGEPRCRGEREAIRVLLATRGQAVEFRTRAISALHALMTSAPDSLRGRLRSLPLGELLRTCAALRGSSRQSTEEFATVTAMRATARRRSLVSTRQMNSRPSSKRSCCPGSTTVSGLDLSLAGLTTADRERDLSNVDECRDQADTSRRGDGREGHRPQSARVPSFVLIRAVKR